MRLVIGNVSTQAVVGGADNLLDFDVMKLLREYLRIRPDGYQHSPLYREHKWDGYRYFITEGGKFATGFLPLVARFLEEHGVSLAVEDKRENLPKLVEQLDGFIGEIDGKIWEATEATNRLYQVDMVSKLNNYIKVGNETLYFPRGIFDAATNAGKNSVAALINNNLDRKYESVFMVSNKTIYKQAVEFFSQVIGEPVGEICSGKYNPKWFTVCMVKTLYNQAAKSVNVKNWLYSREVLYVDESDEAGAKEYSKVLSLCNAGMRIFVSGTPLESKKVNNMVAIGLSGQVLAKVTNKFLMDEGHSQKLTVKILLNRTQSTGLMSYTQEMEKIVHTSLHRLELIKQVLEQHDEEQVLITFIDKYHGYFMYNQLKAMLPNVDMGIVHGTSKDREAVISDFKKNKLAVLFASSILDRGANIPNIRVIIRAAGGKSVTKSKQIAGRATRHDGINDDVLMYDFYDVGKYVGKHSRDRIKTYKNEEFTVEYTFPHHRGQPVFK